jgi:hypothetical protein
MLTGIQRIQTTMMSIAELLMNLANWLPPLLVGTMFTFVGLLKIYGYVVGVVGGAQKPFMTRLCGT